MFNGECLKKKLALYADRMGIISQDQHGFHHNHSTVSNLLAHHKKILEAMKQRKWVDCVLIDLSRAFDRVGSLQVDQEDETSRLLRYSCPVFGGARAEGLHKWTIIWPPALHKWDSTEGHALAPVLPHVLSLNQ